MGDDTPLAVLSNRYRGLHHFFRQNFSQVTNPPIDSLRERHVMTLRTRLGNLGNILDESPEQCDHLLLNSPLSPVTNLPPCITGWVTKRSALISPSAPGQPMKALRHRLTASNAKLRRLCAAGQNI